MSLSDWFSGLFSSDSGSGAAAPSTPSKPGGTGLETPYSVPGDATLGQSEYDFTYRVFPEDIGEQSDRSHYMVININVPNKSTYSKINDQQVFTVLDQELSKTDALRYNIDKKYVDQNGVNQGIGGNIIAAARPRFTRRIKESIVLYIPDTMQFTQMNMYEDVSLTALAAGAASGVVNTTASFLAGLVSVFSSSGGNAIQEGVGTLVDGVGNVVSRAGQLTGSPINPKVEVLFKNSPQRQFDFAFYFAPETPAESEAMYQIIKTLRFHAAPEIDASTQGYTLTPPSEFDITFYDKGEENISIPRINTCVLESIIVDYAPAGGWQTFLNGHPVAAKVFLKFRETEIVSKLRVAQGF